MDILKLYNTRWLWKILGVAAIIVVILYCWVYAYDKGRFDECINHNGFLLREKGSNDLKCYNESYLNSKGFTLNKETKSITKTITNFS